VREISRARSCSRSRRRRPTTIHGHGRRRKPQPGGGGEGSGEEGGDRGRKMGKRRRAAAPVGEELTSPVNSLDDGCLMHIFSFLSPIPGSICSSNLALTPTPLGEMTESRIRKTAGNWRRNCRIGGGCWRCRGTGQN
jgi:hypothetical protein